MAAEQKMRFERMLLVVTDTNGRIVATGAPTAPNKEGVSASLGALPGQTLHRVPITPELEKALKASPGELHQVLSDYELRSGPAMSLLLPRRSRARREG